MVKLDPYANGKTRYTIPVRTVKKPWWKSPLRMLAFLVVLVGIPWMAVTFFIGLFIALFYRLFLWALKHHDSEWDNDDIAIHFMMDLFTWTNPQIYLARVLAGVYKAPWKS